MPHKDILIHDINSIKEAFKQLDKTAEKVLLVVDTDEKLLGTVTDGDIRRHILKGKSLEDIIGEVYNRKPTFIRKNEFTAQSARQLFLKNEIDLIPILDEKYKVIDFITWNQAFADDKKDPRRSGIVDVPVVVMAGGKGTRLEPFSRILPKSLIPIGDRPIAEIIVDEFRKFGVKDFYLTLNYKGKMIESYFDSLEKDYSVKYVWDGESGGTVGSLKLLKDRISDTFILSNCDVIVKADFREVVNLHRREGAAITVLSSVQHHKIPYGVIKIKESGEIADIVEKPEYTFVVNAGVYVISREALDYIPDKASFDMPDLIRNVLKDKKIITYPVNESDYIDIGQWEEYKKSFNELNSL